MHSKQYLLLVASLLIFACSPSQKTTSLAFNETSVSTISNSIKKTTLEQVTNVAKSKTVTPINATELAEIIKTAAGRMYLFSFWTKDCPSCLEQLKQIEEFTTKSAENSPQLVFINLDTNVKIIELNDSLKNHNINTKSFWLKDVANKSWRNLLPETITINQPYLLMVRNDKNILSSYKQTFSPIEIFNLLSPSPLAEYSIN